MLFLRVKFVVENTHLETPCDILDWIDEHGISIELLDGMNISRKMAHNITCVSNLDITFIDVFLIFINEL